MTAPLSQSGLLVVIRAAGERTFEACYALLLQQVPPGQIQVVDQRPFEAALRSCYELGISSGAEWMMTVDADVLIRPGAVKDLQGVANALPEQYAAVEGLVHDKLKGRYREAGHHLYRVKYLTKALSAVPEDGEEIRPEFATLQRLSRLGHPFLKCGTVFGIHDYEQFYRDLYRKAFVHGQKHPDWVEGVLPRWKREADSDPDVAVALRGYCDGFQSLTQARIDTRTYADRAGRTLHELGLREKASLGKDPATLALVEALLANVDSTVGSEAERSMGGRTTEGYRKRGLVVRGLDRLGSLLNRLGDRIQRRAQGRLLTPRTPPHKT